MSKCYRSRSLGIRIPIKLYNLIIHENPNRSFSEIIRTLLFKEYGSKLCAQDIKNNVAATESVSNNVVVHSSDDIDSLIDELFSDSCAQVKKKV